MNIFIIILISLGALPLLATIGSLIDGTTEKAIENIDDTKKEKEQKTKKQTNPWMVIIIIFFISLAFGYLIDDTVSGIIIFSIISVITAVIMSGENREIEKDKIKTEAEEFFKKMKEDKKLPELSSSIFLEKEEKLIAENASELMETRSIRKSSGGFGSIRIAKGIRIGTGSGTSSSSLEWSRLDSGDLYLTTKRIIFRGSKENRNIDISDIFAVDAYHHPDSVGLSLNSKSKNVRFTVDNPYIWSGLIRILKSVENPQELSDINLNIKIE